MKVVIRADASLQMGTGHVMRCLTLADALRAQGAEVQFICRKLDGNLIDFIESKNYHVFTLEAGNSDSIPDDEHLAHAGWLDATQEEDAQVCKVILEDIRPNWLIVDHYALDYRWEDALTHDYQKLMVLDDLADRKHRCDLLLDQTFGRKQDDYKSLVSEACTLLLGSQYALLRPEFALWREYSLKRRIEPELKKMLVTMGGADPDNATGQVLGALVNCELPEDLEVVVVMGLTSPHLSTVQKQTETLPFHVEVVSNVSNMAEIMANADLAIGAAGATTWERCCLGLPSILVVLADNQRFIADQISKHNAAITIDKSQLSDMCGYVRSVLERLTRFIESSSQLTDGRGLKSVLEYLL